MNVGIIVAVDPNWVIGVCGKMPWHYPSDFKRFKKVTMGGTLIMGRSTWESLPKPLPGRRSLVLTRQLNPTSKHPTGSCEYCPNLEAAFLTAESGQHGTNGDIWIAGGAQIYKGALENLVSKIDFCDMTFVPEVEIPKNTSDVVRFPAELFKKYFHLVSEQTNEEDSRLKHCRYDRT